MGKPLKPLIEYVRDETGKKIGCVVALDKWRIGWSLCSKKDVFNKKMARTIAMGRARQMRWRKYELCDRARRYVAPAIVKILDRADRYYKDQ